MNSNVFISSCSTKFYKIVFLKKFTEFTWKHLRSTTLIKRDSSADVFLCKIFKSPLLQNTSVWLHPDFFICLRWFYSRQDVREYCGDIAFFCSCTCIKVLFTDTFLICWFHWKLEVISTFLLWTKITVFLSKSFLSIHVNKVSHYSMAYSQSTISRKSKMAVYFNLNWNEISRVNKFS